MSMEDWSRSSSFDLVQICCQLLALHISNAGLTCRGRNAIDIELHHDPDDEYRWLDRPNSNIRIGVSSPTAALLRCGV